MGKKSKRDARAPWISPAHLPLCHLMPIWKSPFFPLPLKPAPVKPLPHKTDLFKGSQFHTKLWPLANKQACPYKILPWWGQAPASPVEFTPRILKIYPSQGVLFFSTTIFFPSTPIYDSSSLDHNI